MGPMVGRLASGARQRILQRHQRRLSIKLEEIFWTQLESCAKEENLNSATSSSPWSRTPMRRPTGVRCFAPIASSGCGTGCSKRGWPRAKSISN